MPSYRSKSGESVAYSEYGVNLGTISRHFVENPRESAPPPDQAKVTSLILGDLPSTRVRGHLAVPLDGVCVRRRSLGVANASGLTSVKLPPAGDFTDVLRAKSVVGLLGGRFASYFGGSEPLAIPTKTSGTAAAWIADGAPAPESAPVMAEDDQAGVSQTLAASIIVSRKLWKSTDDEIHAYILNDLSAGFAAEVDRAVVAGAGELEPIGLLNLSGVPAGSFGSDGGPPTRAALVEAVRAVGAANGESSATASMGWLTSPDGEAKLRLVDGSSGGSGAWLWSDSDRILGKPAVSTTTVPVDLAKGSGTGLTALAYGNFADVLVNHARAVQIYVDARTYLEGGSVRILAFLDVKVVFRHKASFYLFKDMQTD